MKRFLKTVTYAALIVATGVAQAEIVGFDFATGAGSVQGPHSVTVNGVIATAFDDANFGSSSHLLWFRNQTNDHGLGVCNTVKTPPDNCGPGDLNELDNVDSLEIILLENTNGGDWVSLWVSSLDGSEEGAVFWSNSLSFLFTSAFSFKSSDFGTSVEGDILGLAAAGAFDSSARYLAFIAGTTATIGGDNDYLVWKGTIDVPVPEPGTLGLLGLSMLIVGFVSSRRRAS